MKTTTLHLRKTHEYVLSAKLLLVCGILSSLLYTAMNIFVPMQYPGYSSVSQTVSELSAIDAPTRSLWVILGAVYTSLIVAFGWGIWKSAAQNRSLKIAGILFITYALIGLFWPPMHQREVIAAGGGTLTDTLHLIFTAITVLLMFLIIVLSSAAFGKQFKFYSIATIVVLLTFGALTGMDSPNLEANLPTPLIGVWERMSIGAYMLWVVVLAAAIMKKGKEE